MTTTQRDRLPYAFGSDATLTRRQLLVRTAAIGLPHDWNMHTNALRNALDRFSHLSHLSITLTAAFIAEDHRERAGGAIASLYPLP